MNFLHVPNNTFFYSNNHTDCIQIILRHFWKRAQPKFEARTVEHSIFNLWKNIKSIIHCNTSLKSWQLLCVEKWQVNWNRPKRSTPRKKMKWNVWLESRKFKDFDGIQLKFNFKIQKNKNFTFFLRVSCFVPLTPTFFSFMLVLVEKLPKFSNTQEVSSNKS